LQEKERGNLKDSQNLTRCLSGVLDYKLKGEGACTTIPRFLKKSGIKEKNGKERGNQKTKKG
jgi:hypothetical protein